MRHFFKFAICLIAANCIFSGNVKADIVLTFDQSGLANGTSIDQDYGDRVVASPDSNGHGYNIVAGVNLLTSNVEVDYDAGGVGAALWTSGYGDLTNVLYANDSASALNINFTADAGFEVGLVGFDLAAFGTPLTIPGIEVTDGTDNVLFSVGTTEILGGASRNSFDTSGIFAESLSITVDLTGVEGLADNVAIDNIQFNQRPVPEPASASIVLLGLIGLASRRKR